MDEAEKPPEKPKEPLLLAWNPPKATQPDVPPARSVIAPPVPLPPSHQLAAEVERDSSEKTEFPYRVDFLVALVSLLFPFGWSVSGFPPNIVLACVCWAVTLCAVLHFFWTWSRNTGKYRQSKWIVIPVLPILILIFTYKPVVRQYHIQHSPLPITPPDTNVLALRSDVHDLSRALITNPSTPPSVSISILDDENERLSEQQKQIAQKQKVITETAFDLESLRSERSNKLALDQIQAQGAENQRAREEIQAKEAQKSAEIQDEKNKEVFRQLALATEQHLDKQYLEVFDYTITALHELLIDLKKDTGDKIEFDFQNPPSIYRSALLSDGRIINGTNFIRLGTNYGWNFRITTTNQTKTLISVRMPKYYAIERLSIICAGKTGESTLSIEPLNLGPTGATGDFDSWNIRLGVSNILIIDRNISFSDYKTGIDVALRSLLEAQDAQFPLNSHTKAP